METNKPEISGYEIIDELGFGGMSKVYLAKQLSLNRNVAIKELLINRQEYEEEVRRLIKEGEILAKLNHKNIITVYDLIFIKDRPYLIEEYIDGITLREYMNQTEEIGKQDFVNIVKQIVNGIEAAHKNDIIHRDLKPENILISNDGVVKICDFGIASIKNKLSTQSIANMAGTWEYLAPELFEDTPIVCELNDVYSLGCIIYELLVNKKPIEVNNDETIIGFIKKKLTKEIDLGNNSPDWFKSYAKYFQKCLSRTVDERKDAMDNLNEGIRIIIKSGLADDISITNIKNTVSIISNQEKAYIKEKNDIVSEKITKNSKLKKIITSILIICAIIGSIFIGLVIEGNIDQQNRRKEELIEKEKRLEFNLSNINKSWNVYNYFINGKPQFGNGEVRFMWRFQFNLDSSVTVSRDKNEDGLFDATEIFKYKYAFTKVGKNYGKITINYPDGALEYDANLKTGSEAYERLRRSIISIKDIILILDRKDVNGNRYAFYLY